MRLNNTVDPDQLLQKLDDLGPSSLQNVKKILIFNAQETSDCFEEFVHLRNL